MGVKPDETFSAIRVNKKLPALNFINKKLNADYSKTTKRGQKQSRFFICKYFKTGKKFFLASCNERQCQQNNSVYRADKNYNSDEQRTINNFFISVRYKIFFRVINKHG